jgi:uncharacterized protein (DUF488 family)
VPQFNKEALEADLPKHGIKYRHFPSLGGFRRSIGDASPNKSWRNESFRGFADYMLTDAFREALDQLITLAQKDTTAIMCAEAVPWRCHRSLISDALVVRGVEVRHLLAPNRAEPHQLTPFAQVEEEKITYPKKSP